MTDLPSSSDLERVQDGIAHLEGVVMAAKEQSRKTADRARNLFVAAMVVAVLGVAVGAYGLSVGNRAQDAVDDVIATRIESRAATCEADVNTAERINSLNDRTLGLIVDALAAPRLTPRTADEQAAADAFLAGQRVAFDAIKVPVRDCSPEAIAAFYGDTP